MRRIANVCLITVFLLALTGCSDRADNPPVPTALPTPENQVETILVYSIDPDSLTLIPVAVKKEDKKITARYIVSLVLNNLGEYNIEEPVLRRDGHRLYVSFSQEGEPVRNCKRKVEKLILDCFANSLLDNIEPCSEVVFQINGEAYKSKNFDFKKNEVYTSR